MPAPKILVINACGSTEGDVNVMLLALANFRAEEFNVYAVSVPRGTVYDKLKRMQNIRLIPMELGGSEARKPHRTGAVLEIAEAAASLARLVSLVVREHIELIYCIDRTVAAYLAQAVSRITRRPFVLLAAYPLYGKDSVLNRMVLAQADRIQIHSDYLRSFVLPFTRNPERVVKIADAVQIENYDPARSGDEARDYLKIPRDAPLVILPGRICQWKGHDVLIEAAPTVLARRPDTQFLIVGREDDIPVIRDGRSYSFKEILVELIAHHKLEERVRFAGYVPDLPGVMAAADIITMPSKEEPFGLVALEGMAMGKPVVATTAGGVPEFVIHGETGLLVPPENPSELAKALLELIEDPVRAREMGHKGRMRAERYHDAHVFADSTSALLQSAIASRSQHTRI